MKATNAAKWSDADNVAIVHKEVEILSSGIFWLIYIAG